MTDTAIAEKGIRYFVSSGWNMGPEGGFLASDVIGQDWIEPE